MFTSQFHGRCSGLWLRSQGTSKCTPQHHSSSNFRRWWIGTGCIKEGPNDLLGDIKNGGHDAGIDLIILGTCEIEYVLSSSHSAYTVPISLFWCLTVCHIGTRSSLLHGMLAMLHISSRSFALFITPTMRGGNLPFRSGLDGMLFVFFLSQNSKFLVSPFNHV